MQTVCLPPTSPGNPHSSGFRASCFPAPGQWGKAGRSFNQKGAGVGEWGLVGMAEEPQEEDTEILKAGAKRDEGQGPSSC